MKDEQSANLPSRHSDFIRYIYLCREEGQNEGQRDVEMRFGKGINFFSVNSTAGLINMLFFTASEDHQMIFG